MKDKGVCPVPTYFKFNGAHDGTNAGRACWAVSSSLCNGEKQGVYLKKIDSCKACDFFNQVKAEESVSPHGHAVLPSGIVLYIRKRFKVSHDTAPVDNSPKISPEQIKRVESSFLFFAGYPGRDMIDSIHIDLRYRRSTEMSSHDFDRFVDFLVNCLPDKDRDTFSKSISALLNSPHSVSEKDIVGAG